MPLVHALDKKTVRHEACEQLIDRLLREPTRSADELIAAYSVNGEETQELEALLKTLAPGLSGLKNRNPVSATRWAMGQLMANLLGRMDPKEILSSLEPVVQEKTS